MSTDSKNNLLGLAFGNLVNTSTHDFRLVNFIDVFIVDIRKKERDGNLIQ